MLKNYLKVALRAISRDKIYSLINITGFAIGIACSFLILIWVQDELKFDKFHTKGERIHRVLVTVPSGGENLNVGVTPAGLAPNLEADFPAIEKATRFKGQGDLVLRKGKFSNLEEKAALAGESFFEVFDFSFIEGDRKTCLQDPGKIVLTKTIADRYFPAGDAVGKMIEVVSVGNFMVSAVVDDVTHSHIDFNFVIPFEHVSEIYGHDANYMGTFNYITYTLLEENTSAASLEKDLFDYMKKFANEETDEDEEVSHLFLQPLHEVYLKSDFSYDFIEKGDIRNVYLFSVIAFVVLLIACINFMNLTTARSANRAREIGVRKVHGARRVNIITQFYFESFFITLVSFVIALLLVELTLPVFNQVAGKELSMSIFSEPTLMLVLFGIAIITALIAGSYPAMYLSAFVPQKVLKGSLSSGSKGASFRKILVIVQFAISVILIIATLTISAQMRYIQTKKLGYDKEQLLFAYMTGPIKESYELFKERVKALPGVIGFSSMTNLPVYAGPSMVLDNWEGNPGNQTMRIHNTYVGENFLETMNIELLKGRSFSDKFHDDSNRVYLLNETAVKKMNLKKPIGSRLTLHGQQGTVVGIVKDFNFNTLHNKIEPMALILDEPNTRYAMIRISPHKQQKTLEEISNIWEAYEPDYPSSNRFLTEILNTRYQKEFQTQKLFNYFAIFAIIISCLGLFGLSSFMAMQRRKEIGIRKVMGASVNGLVIKLVSEFVKWVVIANLIAWPIAYIFINSWLQNFTFSISLPYWAFLIAIAIALGIALITVSSQTLKAAQANPANSLRCE
ncbi:MAG: FtsX-like permease family protein [Bacteroidales bacterium]